MLGRASPDWGRWALLLSLILCSLTPAGLLAQPSAPVRVIASALTNPRGFDFAENGDIVVAGAGESGATAGITRIGDDGCPAAIVDGAPSYRVAFGGPVAERPGDYDTDWQPYAMLAMGDAFWATEGTSNQLLRLGLDGVVSRVVDLSAGRPIPTGIDPAPDGGVSVGLFTPAPYREGAASVVEVASDGAVREVWS